MIGTVITTRLRDFVSLKETRAFNDRKIRPKPLFDENMNPEREIEEPQLSKLGLGLGPKI